VRIFQLAPRKGSSCHDSQHMLDTTASNRKTLIKNTDVHPKVSSVQPLFSYDPKCRKPSLLRKFRLTGFTHMNLQVVLYLKCENHRCNLKILKHLLTSIDVNSGLCLVETPSFRKIRPISNTLSKPPTCRVSCIHQTTSISSIASLLN
jgi:hypothetical protein